MARILYAASGDGFGHAVRLHSVGQGLIEKGHDVQFLSCGKTWDYLQALFPNRTHPSFGLFTVYNQGKVEALQTVLHNLQRAWHSFRPALRSLSNLFDRFKPDLVITDFEPFSAHMARLRGVPYISLDNQHLLTHCTLERAPGCTSPLIYTYLTIRLYYAGAKRYLISTFYEAPIRHHPTRLIAPILRPRVYQTQPSDDAFILIYNGAPGENETLRRTLERYDRFPIRAYGLGLEGSHGHVTFKKTNPDGFLADLGSCRAVIATAGHSLVCEAIHLRKPMLLVPLEKHYEQIINARHVQRLGLGTCCDQLNPQILDKFFADLDHYRANLALRPQTSLDSVLKAVEQEIP